MKKLLLSLLLLVTFSTVACAQNATTYKNQKGSLDRREALKQQADEELDKAVGIINDFYKFTKENENSISKYKIERQEAIKIVDSLFTSYYELEKLKEKYSETSRNWVTLNGFLVRQHKLLNKEERYDKVSDGLELAIELMNPVDDEDRQSLRGNTVSFLMGSTSKMIKNLAINLAGRWGVPQK